MTFSDLPVGARFQWRKECYQKISSIHAQLLTGGAPRAFTQNPRVYHAQQPPPPVAFLFEGTPHTAQTIGDTLLVRWIDQDQRSWPVHTVKPALKTAAKSAIKDVQP